MCLLKELTLVSIIYLFFNISVSHAGPGKVRSGSGSRNYVGKSHKFANPVGRGGVGRSSYTSINSLEAVAEQQRLMEEEYQSQLQALKEGRPIVIGRKGSADARRLEAEERKLKLKEEADRKRAEREAKKEELRKKIDERKAKRQARKKKRDGKEEVEEVESDLKSEPSNHRTTSKSDSNSEE